MSRVIKAAVWKEKPHLIDTPEPPKAHTLPDVTLDDESHIMIERVIKGLYFLL